jgi:hypothetical protein
MWFQYDFGEGPLVEERSTQLFCAWLARCRYRVILPMWHKTLPTVVASIDTALRHFGGVPTYALHDYVARNIIVVLCPASLCEQHGQGSRDHGRACLNPGTKGHIIIRARRASSRGIRSSARLAWCRMTGSIT